jgi:hypothetical protein
MRYNTSTISGSKTQQNIHAKIGKPQLKGEEQRRRGGGRNGLAT